MVRRRQRTFARRLAPAAAWLLAVVPLIGLTASARADADLPELSFWASETTARALQAAEPENDPTAGVRELLNRSARLGLQGLQQTGPDWLRRFSFDLTFAETLEPGYDVAATQPLLRSWRRGDLLWLRGHVGQGAGGPLVGDIGLHYRPPVLERELTLSLSGLIEDHGLLDYQRFGIAAALRSPDLELTGTLFDDVADADRAAGGVGDRDLDAYDVAVAARVPQLPWTWVRARRRWQIAIDSETAAARNDLTLQLRPFSEIELEAGISETQERSDWFTRLRLKLRLDGSR
jgi:hypothetical protein